MLLRCAVLRLAAMQDAVHAALAPRPTPAGVWGVLRPEAAVSSHGSTCTSISTSTSQTTSSCSFSSTPDTHPQLVDQLLDARMLNRRDRLQQRKAAIIQEYQRCDGDVGSPEVQVAVLTERIRDLAAHFQQHRKDNHSRCGLMGLLNQRRALLCYLRRSNFQRFCFVLQKLGLKDTYAKQARLDNYRVGTRLGTPAEPRKKYGFR